MPRRPPASPIAVALVLALAGLVAVTSRGTPLLAPLREGRANRLEILLNAGILCVLGMALAALLAWIIRRALIARRPGAPPFRAILLRGLPFIAVALVVLNLLVIARTDVGRGPDPGDPTHAMQEDSDRRAAILNIVGWFGSAVRAGDGQADQEPGTAGSDPGPAVPPLILVIGFGIFVLAGVGAWAWYASRPAAGDPSGDEPIPPDEPYRESVHGAVVGTIDAMLDDPDPNTAIIGAYARLLEGLDACGAGRRDHEAPEEHIQRVLAVVDVTADPLRRLLALFQMARFSTHPLTTAHRDQALAALREVAAEIAEARPTARPVGGGV